MKSYLVNHLLMLHAWSVLVCVTKPRYVFFALATGVFLAFFSVFIFTSSAVFIGELSDNDVSDSGYW